MDTNGHQSPGRIRAGLRRIGGDAAVEGFLAALLAKTPAGVGR